MTTRRVTYSHGTIYLSQLQEACDRQRTCKGCVINQAKKNVRFLWYLYGILIGKCVQCMIITAVTHCGSQTRNNQEFCNHSQDVFIGWGWSLSVYFNIPTDGFKKTKAEVKSTANCGTILLSLCDPGVRFSNVPITLWARKAFLCLPCLHSR